jgi:hypothetical protein
MSVDLSVWSSKPIELPDQLPQSGSWKRDPYEWRFPGDGWHVLVMSTEEDLPSAVLERLPTAAHGVYVTSEPIGADPAGYGRLENVVRALAKVSNGVWLDHNETVYMHDEGMIYNPLIRN